jgi:hypothetical protein
MTILTMVGISRDPKNAASTTESVSGRAVYAQTYDAFWRADDKTDPTLMTATLFAPSVVSALRGAGEKTTTESSMLDTVTKNSRRDVSVFMTFDSIFGNFSDATIQKSVRLTINTTTVSANQWTPIIGTSRIVNAPAGAASQQGFLRFRFDRDIDWSSIEKIQLDVAGLPKAKNRSFTWSGAIIVQANP